MRNSTNHVFNKVISNLFRTTVFIVWFPQGRQTLNPINPSANPSLISLDDRTPKVIIVAKPAFPFGADHQHELLKAIRWTSGTVRFKWDDISPIAMLSAVFISTGHHFVALNDTFWQQPLLSFCVGMEKCIVPPQSGNHSNTATSLALLIHITHSFHSIKGSLWASLENTADLTGHFCKLQV